MSSEITINSNIASLQSQRRLGQNTSALRQVFERLSSGQRINRASDDAAGLAISESLRADQRVLSQGVRNLNDGISLLNISEGAVAELTNIVMRVEELAEQAANGTLGSRQRLSLDKEAQQLSKEYTRIAQTAEFNGLKLFDGNNGDIALQAGYGASATLGASTGGKMGTGSFDPKADFGTASQPRSVPLGDLNGDGFLDIVAGNDGSSSASVLLGNGDGTFKAKVDYATLTQPRSVALGDLNGDGVLDIVATDYSSSSTSVLLGNGDGTFKAKSDFVTGFASFVTLGDLNGDGFLDIVTANGGNVCAAVLLGNGNGTFKARATYGTNSGPSNVALGDLNGDGVLDIVTMNNGGGNASVLLGNGDGTFQARTDFGTPGGGRGLALGDLNGDGILDIVVAGASAVVLLGNGDGSFKANVNFVTGTSPWSVALGDLNGDGFLDIATANSGSSNVSVLLGNGDGSFKAKADIATGGGAISASLGDLNGDGVLDIASANRTANTVSALISQTRTGISPLLPFTLQTQADAKWALELMKRKVSHLSQQRGIIGANQSRIGSAINNIQITVENFAAAESQIRDTDVAQEAANLAKGRILQQAAASVLAQANLGPQIALTLLQGR